jgi:uncharacterized protein (TIGR02217 family)
MAVDYPAIILEDDLAVGFKGGPNWSTSRVESLSGYSQRNQQRSRPVHTYSYSSAEKDRATLLAIKGFHTSVRGALYTWLLKDWGDYSRTSESLGIGDGVETDYQLVSNEGPDNPYVRTIQYTKSGTLNVYVNDVLQTITTDYSVSATGLITFVVAPASSLAVTADYEFYVPVSFDQDSCQIEITARSGEWGVISTLDAIEELPAV